MIDYSGAEKLKIKFFCLIKITLKTKVLKTIILKKIQIFIIFLKKFLRFLFMYWALEIT